jgi:hypothetical protein
MASSRLEDSYAQMVELGMRPLLCNDGVGVLELRGGTHLVILPTDDEGSGRAPFDLMVEDLDMTHKRLTEMGLSVSEIERGDIHDSFTVRDPSGLDVVFNSTHVTDQPV